MVLWPIFIKGLHDVVIPLTIMNTRLKYVSQCSCFSLIPNNIVDVFLTGIFFLDTINRIHEEIMQWIKRKSVITK